MELRHYRIYGVTIRSAIPLTFPEGPAAAPDIVLSCEDAETFRPATAGLSRTPNGDDWYSHVACADGSNFVSWPDLFEFLVSADGRSVRCCPLRQSTFESFQTYLLGHVLSFALVTQGCEPLHATVVVVDGRGVVLLGPSGQGKSTLAAAFLHAGHQILTDDLLLIGDVDGTLSGFPGPPRLKLFPDVARRFLPAQAALARMNPDSDKFIIELCPGQAFESPAPIHAFVVLDGQENGSLEMTPLAGRAAWLELLTATFNKRLTGPARLARQFKAVREWSAGTPVMRIRYEWNIDAIDELVRAIVDDVRLTREALV